MRATEGGAPDRRFTVSVVIAVFFFAISTVASWARWANFEYRTFDLAYYVQAIWQLIHGRWEVSLLHVPLLGNHVEPIVFLFAPLFALFQHPMLFVAVQNAALATMAPVGFLVARRIGIPSPGALLLAAALLLTPAAGYIALHEFHPEALAAPFLLLMLHARAIGSLGRYTVWFVAALACKENIALLLAAYCAVHLLVERRRPARELRNWYVWPLLGATAWFILCTKVITPALNSGSIDYLELYSRLGDSSTDIVINAFREPRRVVGALSQSLTSGNLLWGLLLPFLALPIFRPRWLLIASPILLQHLLSWRSSEWTIYFHYAAPLLPLFWIATVEVVASLHSRQGHMPPAVRNAIPLLILLACVAGQALLGPAAAIASTVGRWPGMKHERARKAAFLAAIDADASVMAPLPYLSHLAAREKLYSLHYVLKGLKTLSRSTYEPPPPPDFVLIDYNDHATFDSAAGYYHPTMRTADGRIIPSSDQLLHNFLKSSAWSSLSQNELTLLKRDKLPGLPEPSTVPDLAGVAPGTELLSLKAVIDPAAGTVRVMMAWRFDAERSVFPWMLLKFVPKEGGAPLYATRGLCAPEAAAGAHHESWSTDAGGQLPPGDYTVEAIFVDNTKRAWVQSKGERNVASEALLPPIALGELRVSGSGRSLIPR